MTPTRYDATGDQAEFEPGSRGRVLKNLLGIRRVGDMQREESEALLVVQEWAVAHFDNEHRFAARDVCELHRQWLSGIYTWAGSYRQVNMAKGDFMFAAAGQIPRLMQDFERKQLAVYTPCASMDEAELLTALARTHAELVIIHPFRDGNGRCSRLLAWLMALQAGLPPLDFSSLAGRGKGAYIAAIHAAFQGDYAPLEARFSTVIRRTLRAYGQP
jgi:cell filamentation protein